MDYDTLTHIYLHCSSIRMSLELNDLPDFRINRGAECRKFHLWARENKDTAWESASCIVSFNLYECRSVLVCDINIILCLVRKTEH